MVSGYGVALRLDFRSALSISPGVRNMIKRRWGFKSKKQLPLFMVWDEEWQDGDVVFAWVIFNSRDWIGI
jgi:hypothetical protein